MAEFNGEQRKALERKQKKLLDRFKKKYIYIEKGSRTNTAAKLIVELAMQMV